MKKVWKNPDFFQSSYSSSTTTRIKNIAQNIFFNLKTIDNRIKWKNYVTVTRVKLSVELDVELVIRERSQISLVFYMLQC